MPLALAYLALARRRGFALGVVAAAASVRVALHLAAHRIMAAPRRPSLALIPLRDVLGLAIWVAGLRGDEVRWRGRPIQIAPDGEIEPEVTSRS